MTRRKTFLEKLAHKALYRSGRIDQSYQIAAWVVWVKRGKKLSLYSRRKYDAACEVCGCDRSGFA